MSLHTNVHALVCACMHVHEDSCISAYILCKCIYSYSIHRCMHQNHMIMSLGPVASHQKVMLHLI